jgi:hypothetical protein
VTGFCENSIYLWFPYYAGIFLTSCGTVSSSRRAVIHVISYSNIDLILLYNTWLECVVLLPVARGSRVRTSVPKSDFHEYSQSLQ